MAGRWSHGRKEQPSESHPRVQNAKMDSEGTWTYENGKAVFKEKREVEDTWRTPRKGYPPDAAFEGLHRKGYPPDAAFKGRKGYPPDEDKGWKGAWKGKWKDDDYGGGYRGGKDAMDSALRPGKGKGKSSGAKGKGPRPGRRRNDDEDEDDAFGDRREWTSEEEVEEKEEERNGQARAHRRTQARDEDEEDGKHRDEEEDEDADAEAQEAEEEYEAEEGEEGEEEEEAEEEEEEEEEDQEEDMVTRFFESRITLHKRGEQGLRLRITMNRILLRAKQAEVLNYCKWLDQKLAAIRREYGDKALHTCKADVDFSQNHLTDSMVRPILQTFVDHDVSIALLKLHKNKLTSKTIDMICDFMNRSSEAEPLMEIHLSHNSIDDTGALHLLKEIKRNFGENGQTGIYPVLRFHDILQRRVCVPVWVRLEQNQVRGPDDVLAAAKQLGISVCHARDRALCGPAKCWNKHLPNVHLYGFSSQAATNKRGGAKPSASSGKGKGKGPSKGKSSSSRDRGPGDLRNSRAGESRQKYWYEEEEDEDEEPRQGGGGGGKGKPRRRHRSEMPEDGASRRWPKGKGGGDEEADESRWAWNAGWDGWDSSWASSWHQDTRWNYWEF